MAIVKCICKVMANGVVAASFDVLECNGTELEHGTKPNDGYTNNDNKDIREEVFVNWQSVRATLH